MEKNLDVAGLCVSPDLSIRRAAARMDQNHIGLILVVDSRRRLAGTVTDGDLRRALLAKINLDLPVRTLLARKKGLFAKPITAPLEASREACLALLKKYRVLHLPLLDKKGRVAGLATRDEFLPGAALPLSAVVMAGGKGSRLMPLTKNTPKPMLPVGDKPMMEIIFNQLRDLGIKQVRVATHHQREKITDHFGDGKRLGIDLSYVYEDRPLGTAGALSLMRVPKETTLVMNADVLTQINFRAMLKYHKEMKADLTTAVCQYDFKIPYGVVECDGPRVRRINEKPTLEFFVCAGIYLLEPSACRLIPKGRRFDMTDLISRLIARGRKVASFPIREYWLDIGKPDDYAAAQRQAQAWAKQS